MPRKDAVGQSRVELGIGIQHRPVLLHAIAVGRDRQREAAANRPAATSRLNPPVVCAPAVRTRGVAPRGDTVRLAFCAPSIGPGARAVSVTPSADVATATLRSRTVEFWNAVAMADASASSLPMPGMSRAKDNARDTCRPAARGQRCSAEDDGLPSCAISPSKSARSERKRDLLRQTAVRSKRAFERRLTRHPCQVSRRCRSRCAAMPALSRRHQQSDSAHRFHQERHAPSSRPTIRPTKRRMENADSDVSVLSTLASAPAARTSPTSPLKLPRPFRRELFAGPDAFHRLQSDTRSSCGRPRIPEHPICRCRSSGRHCRPRICSRRHSPAIRRHGLRRSRSTPRAVRSP